MPGMLRVPRFATAASSAASTQAVATPARSAAFGAAPCTTNRTTAIEAALAGLSTTFPASLFANPPGALANVVQPTCGVKVGLF